MDRITPSNSARNEWLRGYIRVFLFYWLIYGSISTVWILLQESFDLSKWLVWMLAGVPLWVCVRVLVESVFETKVGQKVFTWALYLIIFFSIAFVVAMIFAGRQIVDFLLKM